MDSPIESSMNHWLQARRGLAGVDNPPKRREIAPQPGVCDWSTPSIRQALLPEKGRFCFFSAPCADD